MITEFALIDRFLAPFSRLDRRLRRSGGAGVVVGPGDDCAVVAPAPGTELCITTDAIVEGVHFTAAKFSSADIGHKALAVNLSDLAAMGARPRWFLCSVACRPEDVSRMPGIAAGMAALAAKTGAVLVGGNFSRADKLSLHITAIGDVPRGQALTRAGAQPRDRLYVTGTLGDAALALALRQIGRPTGPTRARQNRPTPKVLAGQLARPLASAAIDISDGLLQDVQHLCEASGVGAVIDALAIPRSRAFTDANANLDLALTGGEDYELALAIPPARAKAFEAAMKKAGEKPTLIGEITRGSTVSVRNAPHLESWGHDHFGHRSAPTLSATEFARATRPPRRRKAR